MRCDFVSPRGGISCELDSDHDGWHLAWDGNVNPVLKMWKGES